MKERPSCLDQQKPYPGGSIPWPVWPASLLRRDPPKRKVKYKLERTATGEMMVQVFCYLPGAHRNIMLTVQAAATLDDIQEAAWTQYQTDMQAKQMFCPSMARNCHKDAFKLLPALGNGTPDCISPALKPQWLLQDQMSFPYVLVFVEAPWAQMANQELDRRCELEQQELCDLEAICRHTLSSLYSSFLCLTLDAVQDSINAFAEWRAYLSNKLVQDIANLTGQVDRAQFVLRLEENTEREALGRALIQSRQGLARQQVQRLAKEDQEAIELEERMSVLKGMLCEAMCAWGEYCRNTVRPQMRRCELEKQLLFDTSLHAAGLCVDPTEPLADPEPEVIQPYTLIVHCQYPNAPSLLQLQLDPSTTGAAVLATFWTKVVALNNGAPPQGWPSPYPRDFSLAANGEEDPVLLALPLRDQLEDTFECRVVEGPQLLARKAKWQERQQTLDKVEEEMRIKQQNQVQRLEALSRQELVIRAALGQEQVAAMDMLMRRGLGQGENRQWQELAHKIHYADVQAWEEEAERQLRHHQSSLQDAASHLALADYEAKFTKVLQDHDDLFLMVFTLMQKYYDANRCLLMPFGEVHQPEINPLQSPLRRRALIGTRGLLCRQPLLPPPEWAGFRSW